MKSVWIRTVIPLTLAVMIAVAYGQVTPPGAPPGAPRGANDGPITGSFTAPTADASIDPVTQAIEMNNAEIALARIASEKAQNSRVRSFAEMLIKDHTAALTKLQSVQGVTTTEMKPNPRHQATADRLSKLYGMEFDREYMRAMVADHQDAVKFFEQQSKATDSAAPAPGKTTLARVSQDRTPTVREHLLEAQNILKYLETTPPKAHNGTNTIRLGIASKLPS
jgi:putative membrane protein